MLTHLWKLDRDQIKLCVQKLQHFYFLCRRYYKIINNISMGTQKCLIFLT